MHLYDSNCAAVPGKSAPIRCLIGPERCEAIDDWYPFGVSTIVKPFCDKLASKGQQDWKRRQAADAIALYQGTLLRAAEYPLPVGDGEDRIPPSPLPRSNSRRW